MCCWPMKIRHSQAHLLHRLTDRKSTRLNSSHSQISYAVFCLKKKKMPFDLIRTRPFTYVDLSVLLVRMFSFALQFGSNKQPLTVVPDQLDEPCTGDPLMYSRT